MLLWGGRPLIAADSGGVEENGGVENPPALPTPLGAPGWEWCCPAVPMVATLGPAPAEPMAAPAPDEPVAVQKTLATICEGVMPTTGTLALG